MHNRLIHVVLPLDPGKEKLMKKTSVQLQSKSNTPWVKGKGEFQHGARFEFTYSLKHTVGIFSPMSSQVVWRIGPKAGKPNAKNPMLNCLKFQTQKMETSTRSQMWLPRSVMRRSLNCADWAQSCGARSIVRSGHNICD